MKKLFGVAVSGKLTAVHDDYDVVKRYSDTLNNEYNLSTDIVKVSKKIMEREANLIHELYLVRYGDTYIQSKYYSIAKDEDIQFRYDLEYTKDTLIRLLEFSDKGSKHIIKTVSLLEKELERLESVPKSPYIMENLLELRNSFYYRMNSEN